MVVGDREPEDIEASGGIEGIEDIEDMMDNHTLGVHIRGLLVDTEDAVGVADMEVAVPTAVVVDEERVFAVVVFVVDNVLAVVVHPLVRAFLRDELHLRKAQL